MWLISYTGSEKSKTCMHRLKANRKIWCENTTFEHDCYFIHHRGIRRTKNFTLAIIHENILRERDRECLPSFSPSCSVTWTPLSVSPDWEFTDMDVTLCKGSNISEDPEGELSGEFGESQVKSDWEAITGGPWKQTKVYFFFYIMASHKMYL